MHENNWREASRTEIWALQLFLYSKSFKSTKPFELTRSLSTWFGDGVSPWTGKMEKEIVCRSIN